MKSLLDRAERWLCTRPGKTAVLLLWTAITVQFIAQPALFLDGLGFAAIGCLLYGVYWAIKTLFTESAWLLRSYIRTIVLEELQSSRVR
ncbi:hypothetical protein RAAC3_TM7C00001G0252 [Candidatus Saccharibacteria bacterium RAAC3_TM7_1]|nr:hypothetical protein RAAC3_TM7C00001G0252 [Candidatus Saccharibacteria bacterium RAAC3_TM7_1]